MSETTRPDIGRIKALAEAASPGKWFALQHSGGWRVTRYNMPPGQTSIPTTWQDAVFIAAARTAVPELCAWVEELERALGETLSAIGDQVVYETWGEDGRAAWERWCALLSQAAEEA